MTQQKPKRTAPNPKQARVWDRIQSIRAKASQKVCMMGAGEDEDKRPSDPRGYGDALKMSYPTLEYMANGQWDEATAYECLQIIKDACDRRSAMLLAVAIAVLEFNPKLRKAIPRHLSPEQQQRYIHLIRIGKVDDDVNDIFCYFPQEDTKP